MGRVGESGGEWCCIKKQSQSRGRVVLRQEDQGRRPFFQAETDFSEADETCSVEEAGEVGGSDGVRTVLQPVEGACCDRSRAGGRRGFGRAERLCRVWEEGS